jgi:hypothetical protein
LSQVQTRGSVLLCWQRPFDAGRHEQALVAEARQVASGVAQV